MKIIADDKIPFLRGVLETFADVVYVPGKMIDHYLVRDADALLIRTRTKCNEALLKDTNVRFIGTATIGYDHIDTCWCEANGIIWKNAPGCNARSVNQYIASTLFHLSEKIGFSLKDRTLGVVGVGNVGSKIVKTAELMGMKVYLCDPPRARDEGTCGFISLEGILRECDILTFHVPLNREGPDKTYHLVNETMINHVNPGTIIINSSRGEVADTLSLKSALRKGKIDALALDVWENEPDIDIELMNACSQATPHIAGYSTDGKANGTTMVVRELSSVFNLGMEDWEPAEVPQPAHPVIVINCVGLPDEVILRKAVLGTYDVREDDQRLRQNPAGFEKLRGDYPLRREFTAYTLELNNASETVRKTCRKMGFSIL